MENGEMRRKKGEKIKGNVLWRKEGERKEKEKGRRMEKGE